MADTSAKTPTVSKDKQPGSTPASTTIQSSLPPPPPTPTTPTALPAPQSSSITTPDTPSSSSGVKPKTFFKTPVAKPTKKVTQPGKTLQLFKDAMNETPPEVSPPPTKFVPPTLDEPTEPVTKKKKADSKEDDKDNPYDPEWFEKELRLKEQTTAKKPQPLKLKAAWTEGSEPIPLTGRRQIHQSPWGWKLMSPTVWWDWSANEFTMESEHQIAKEMISQHVEKNIMDGNIPTTIEHVVISDSCYHYNSETPGEGIHWLIWFGRKGMKVEPPSEPLKMLHVRMAWGAYWARVEELIKERGEGIDKGLLPGVLTHLEKCKKIDPRVTRTK